MDRKRKQQPTRECVSKKSRRRIIYSSSEEEDIPSSPEQSRVRQSVSPAASTRRRASSRVRQSVSSTATRITNSSRVQQSTFPSASTPRRASSRVRRESPRQHLSPEVIINNNDVPLSPSVSPRPKSPTPEETVHPEELELDEDMLQLLGAPPKDETPLGPAIHKDVAKRWQDILAKGLPKEVKDKLLEEYFVPSNCDLLQAPTLNPEAKVALTEVMTRRDASLMNKQKQLGLALAALATAMELVISNETSKKKLFKPLSDACRILCDSHYAETKTRRSLVLSSINTSLKETLIESPRDDKLLFGENVSEKLKAAKTIQRSGESLKPAQKFTKSNFYAKNRNRPNFRPIYRKTNNKQISADIAGATRAARAAPPRQPRSAPAPPYRQTDRERSPPPPPPPRRTYYRR